MGFKDALGGFGGKIFDGLKSSERGYGEAMGSINDAYGRANKAIQPYQNYGITSLADLQQFTGAEDPYAAIESDPSYKAGLGAVTNSAAANNRLLSGRHMKELLDYGGSSYDRILNRKLGVADWGYNTGAGKSADLAIGQGNALAGLQTGQANAKQNRYQGYLDLGMNLGGKAFGIGGY